MFKRACLFVVGWLVCNLASAQVLPNGRYIITSRLSGLAVDVSEKSRSDGANVNQWKYHGGENQQFEIINKGGDYYLIRAVHSRKAISTYGDSKESDVNVHQWTYKGKNNQIWKISPSGSGYYTITSKHSGLYLGVKDGSRSNGGDIRQYNASGGYDQQWKFERVFKHPGVLNTEADFDRMRAKVAHKQEPWLSGWKAMIGDSYSKIRREKPRPLTTMTRGRSGNYGQLFGDLWVTNASAIRWKVSGDTAYAEQAVKFLNAWSSKLKKINGHDKALTGFYGYQLANTADIMRTYKGWSKADQKRFADMLLDVFYPVNTDFLNRHNGTCISHYWANWDLASIASIMAIGIFTDREDIYLEALDYLYDGKGNGALDYLLTYRHPGNMGQYQESGRDQGHTTLGMATFGAIAKMAWNQGDDIFAYNNYQLLAISEYIAKYNLMEEVPFKPYNNCDDVNQKANSANNHGHARPGWALLYNHYVNRLGIAAPWTTKMAEKLQPESLVRSLGGDQPSWGTLTESLDPYPLGGAPRGLTSTILNGEVVLSWWGAAGAESYRLKRSESPEGPYRLIASRGADELLTYTDVNAQDGKRYYYQVTAISPVGESEPSNRVAVRAGNELLLNLTFDNQGSGAAEGVIGKAMVMDGVDDFLEMDGSLFSNLNDFTMAGWVKLDKGKKWQRLLDIGSDTQRFMTLVPYSGDRQACFVITKLGVGEGEHHVRMADEVCGGTPVIGEWMHLAVTLSGSTAVLYLNGEEVARRESMRQTPAQLGVLDQAWVGRSQFKDDPWLDGLVDDVRLYSGALTAAEIDDLVAMGGRRLRLQAEDGDWRNARVDTNYGGYSGSGFVNLVGEGHLEWTVNIPEADTYAMSVRYALGHKGSRPLKLLVDGTPIQTLPFGTTGSWSHWASQEENVKLSAGTHAIRLQTTGNSGANIDSLSLVSTGKQ
ncbi:carbohydrate-binding protein [Marinobacter halodurans]|uniref:Carbohydrate-binding protein n=1 Tax=Marinobacter halodurans TaxID=2528979 RepID=A0ABY1ZSN5_9GAMM|nr:RICIN domain-containing protein [Marinobacter halodurans]TBW58463.1 carbohydrate-binding protein [Marinobacter halodurans]